MVLQMRVGALSNQTGRLCSNAAQHNVNQSHTVGDEPSLNSTGPPCGHSVPSASIDHCNPYCYSFTHVVRKLCEHTPAVLKGNL